MVPVRVAMFSFSGRLGPAILDRLIRRCLQPGHLLGY
jgi:hypothetical protein